MKRVVICAGAAALIVSGICTDSELSAKPWHAYTARAFVGATAGFYEFIVQDKLPSPYTMTEVRAINATKGAMDLGVTGSIYDDPTDHTLPRNVGFLVSESRLDGMYIKSNRGPIVFTTWPDLSIRLEKGRVDLPAAKECPAPPPASGMRLCVTTGGVLYATGKDGTVTRLASP